MATPEKAFASLTKQPKCHRIQVFSCSPAVWRNRPIQGKADLAKKAKELGYDAIHDSAHKWHAMKRGTVKATRGGRRGTSRNKE